MERKLELSVSDSLYARIETEAEKEKLTISEWCIITLNIEVKYLELMARPGRAGCVFPLGFAKDCTERS